MSYVCNLNKNWLLVSGRCKACIPRRLHFRSSGDSHVISWFHIFAAFLKLVITRILTKHCVVVSSVIYPARVPLFPSDAPSHCRAPPRSQLARLSCMDRALHLLPLSPTPHTSPLPATPLLFGSGCPGLSPAVLYM